MDRELAIRTSSLYAPIAVAALLWIWRQPLRAKPREQARRIGAGMLLAGAWNASALLIVNVIATRAGWWTFQVQAGLLAGIPVDLYVGWIVLWSLVPILAFPSWHMLACASVMVGLDLLLMPFCEPVVRLGPQWLIGEAVAVLVSLLPAQYVARWTTDDRRLEWRALLQVVAFAGLTLMVIPAAVLQQVGADWSPLDRGARWTSILLQLLAIPAVLGLSAVQEFVTRGRGTPIPYDPPHTLVTTGPYAFVANPMQLALAGVFVMWAVILDNGWMIGGALMTLAYGAGLASWHERHDLIRRFGEPWVAYRRQVHDWRPRWRPFIRDEGPGVRDQAGEQRLGDAGQRARLYIAQSCPMCRGVGAWLLAHGIVGVDLIPAERHPSRTLLRMTYEPAAGGPIDEGVAAFARALEHVNLGWAWIGMLIRLPIVRPFLQIVVDASGGYPRPTARSSVTSTASLEDSKRSLLSQPQSTARCHPHQRQA